MAGSFQARQLTSRCRSPRVRGKGLALSKTALSRSTVATMPLTKSDPNRSKNRANRRDRASFVPGRETVEKRQRFSDSAEMFSLTSAKLGTAKSCSRNLRKRYRREHALTKSRQLDLRMFSGIERELGAAALTAGFPNKNENRNDPPFGGISDY